MKTLKMEIEWHMPHEPAEAGKNILVINSKLGSSQQKWISTIKMCHDGIVTFCNEPVLAWAYCPEEETILFDLNSNYNQEWISFLHNNALKTA